MASLVARNVDQVEKRNRVLHLTAARTLQPFENVVRVTANTSTDSYILTLPPASSCEGVTFSFYVTSIANSKTVTIASSGEGWSNLVFTATGDLAVLQSDGVRWDILEEITT